MPRPTTTPSYLLHKASGRGRCRVRGRDHYFPGPHNSPESLRAYHRFCEELLATGSPPDRPIDRASRLTVAELVLRYYRHRLTQGLQARIISGVLKPNLRRLRTVYGDLPAEDISPRQIGVLVQRAVGDGLCRSTINTKLLRTVKQLYKWATREELVPAEVFARVSTVEPLRRGELGVLEREPVRPVDDATVEATLPHLGPDVADMVRVQRLTAMRPGEVCAMCWAEIDTAGEVWHFRPSQHKTAHHGKARDVAIGPRAQSILMRYRDRPADLPIFSPRQAALRRSESRRAARRTPLGPRHTERESQYGTPDDPRFARLREGYITQSYGRAIRTACKRAGIDPWSPNRLRHTAATELRARVGVQHASDYLGHAKPDTTAIYAEIRQESIENIAARFG